MFALYHLNNIVLMGLNVYVQLNSLSFFHMIKHKPSHLWTKIQSY